MPRARRARTLGASSAGALALTTMLGFAPADRQAAQAVTRDSAGVAIVSTPGAVARSQVGWSVESTPDVIVGREGVREYEFQRIESVRGFLDGRIVVLDGGRGELRLYDETGSFVARAGGFGAGPGEFRRPLLVALTSEDGILVHDGPRNRFTRFSADLGTVETTSPTRPVRGLPAGIVADGRVLMHSGVTVVIGGADQAEPTPIAFSFVSPVTGATDTVAVLDGPQTVSAELGSVRESIPVPFRIYPGVAVGNGSVYLHATGGPEVLRIDSAGSVAAIFRIEEPVRPITREDVDAAARRTAELLGERASDDQWREAYREAPIPDVMPSFRRLLVDAAGYIWCEVYRAEQEPRALQRVEPAPVTWIVLGPDGRAVGSIETPVGLDVQDVGADDILGVHTDALGIQTIRRHRLIRQP